MDEAIFEDMARFFEAEEVTIFLASQESTSTAPRCSQISGSKEDTSLGQSLIDLALKVSNRI